MLHDPPVPDDGTCAQCGGKRRTVPKVGKSYATFEQYAADPFCSTECCREWHGTVISPHSIWSRDHGREAPVRPARIWCHGTVNGYEKHHCRCDDCRAAATAARRRRREQRAKEKALANAR